MERRGVRPRIEDCPRYSSPHSENHKVPKACSSFMTQKSISVVMMWSREWKPMRVEIQFIFCDDDFLMNHTSQREYKRRLVNPEARQRSMYDALTKGVFKSSTKQNMMTLTSGLPMKS